jgi:hypothetical protein
VSVFNSHVTLFSSLIAIGKSKGVLLAGKEAATSVSILLVPGEVGVEAKEGHCRTVSREGKVREEVLGNSRPKTGRVVDCGLNHLG